MRSGRCSTNRSALSGSFRLAVAAASLSAGAAWAVVPDHCISLDVPAAFLLPDGAVRPAGELRICLDRNLNPVTGMHRVYVGHMPVGLLTSRVSNAEISGEPNPSVLFHVEKGRLRLVGYTVTVRGKAFSYRLWIPPVAPGVEIAGSSAGGGRADDNGESVLLAARLD